MNVEIHENKLRVNFHDIYFEYSIRQIIIMDTRIIVLLKIPSKTYNPSNIISVDFKANIQWCIQKTEEYYNKSDKLSSEKYVGMHIRENDNMLQVNDYLGRIFIVDPTNGHIIDKCNQGREW